MRIGSISWLALPGVICLGMAAPQLAAAAMSPAGLRTGTEAVTPLVTEVKKWKNKNWKNKNWNRGRVYRGPRRAYVRGWNRRPYYGAAIAGVVLGAVIAAAAAPRAPADNVCWYWTNPAKTHGYWDYCY